MPLESGAISQQETERKAQELLREFYLLFFTGSAVMVAGASVTLPKCDFFYAVQAIPKASDKPQIHTVFTDWKPKQQFDGTTKRVHVDVTAQITVRVGEPGIGKENPDHMVRRVGDAVRQLFESEKILLAQKGIRHCSVRRGPTALPISGMAARMLIVAMQFQYQAAA